MPSKSYAGRTFDVDGEGFFLVPSGWTPEVGAEIAKELGVEMNPDGWKVVEFARADFASEGQSPGLRRITAQTGVGMKTLYATFPKGPGKLIARIAGTPKPKSCL